MVASVTGWEANGNELAAGPVRFLLYPVYPSIWTVRFGLPPNAAPQRDTAGLGLEGRGAAVKRTGGIGAMGIGMLRMKL